MIDNNFFIEKIKELYSIILQPIESMYKITAINKYKKFLGVGLNSTFGEIYINILKGNKNLGVVYTPNEISVYMIREIIKKEDLINNAFIKVIDPSCGCGNILIPCFMYLYELYMENLDEINKYNDVKLNKSNISEHIIKNNLYGIDIDELAIKILIIDLFVKSKFIEINNFKIADFLIDNINEKFHFIIGNPPYVGHKLIGKEYFRKLKCKYEEVYNNKGDMSYCFFKAALKFLKSNGKVAFITSRYFIESQSGEKLRKFIKENFFMYKLVDFYGLRPFKNIGIDPVIIFLGKDKIKENRQIEIIKPFNHNKKEFYNSLFLNNGNCLKKFYISKSYLNNDGWVLKTKEEFKIIEKINSKSVFSLKDICNSYQGVITGCDKAFIVTKEDIINENLEKDVIRPWIKNSCIEKNHIKDNLSYIIYSDLISDIESYPNIKNHIKPFKNKLLKRRECVKNMRKWYELQWGRDYRIFEEEKIVFPYKSSKNRFALNKGSYFSADVYCIILKKNNEFTYSDLLDILNSDLYQFYFQSFGKKLGENIYEYYPNNLMKIKLPDVSKIKSFEDDSIYTYYQLEEKEIDIVKENCL
ncbi:Eco57I restriction-modification methylase domain-containing protein [Clostridium rectalis]|uniref:Eco57I restriction-modification methylase domain-containing protein n=1 Tax=Clostridium rectalis TaxID=2040295 RepID=UPI000F64429F|nr:DNA methyltransferase [Clostridium rectalis]